MQVQMAGSVGLSSRIYKGNGTPFQGWIYNGESMVAAPTLEIRHPGPALSLTTWLSLPSQSEAMLKHYSGTMQVNHTGEANQWSLLLLCSGGKILIERTPEALHVVDSNCSPEASEYGLVLSSPDDISKHQKAYQHLKLNLTKKYPTYQQPVKRLLKITLAILGTFLVQESLCLFFVWKRWFRVLILLRVMSCTVLLVVGFTWNLL